MCQPLDPIRTLCRVRAQPAVPPSSTTKRVASLRNAYCESNKPSPLGPNAAFRWKTPCSEAKRSLRRMALGFGLRMGRQTMAPNRRKRVLVLGTGWAAVNFLRTVDPTKFEVVVVSPRDYFTFSPLLPSIVGGALSARATMEPIRDLTMLGGKRTIEFFEATAEDINVHTKVVHCRGVNNGEEFKVPYDFLIYSVGAETNTFGVPGVEGNAYFLKEVEHAVSLHNRMIDNFETANLPSTPLDEKRRLLHIVIVGGGPTGVETAAEISDYVRNEGVRHYADLAPLVKISLVEMLPKLLPTFNSLISTYTTQNFQTKMPNINVCVNTVVTGVTPTEVSVKRKLPDGSEKLETMPYGVILWASGVGQVPLSKKLMQSVEAQRDGRWLKVDGHLRVVGTNDVFALGDCAMVAPEKPSASADSLFKAAVSSPTGAGTTWLKNFQSRLSTWKFPHFDESFVKLPPECRDNLPFEEFRELLKDLESTYRPPIPTAQNAKQAGKFLGTVFNDVIKDSESTAGMELPIYCPTTRGQLAYIGNNRGVGQIKLKCGKLLDRETSILGGIGSGIFWKSVYWTMSYSKYNMFLQSVEYSRSLFRGRDSGRAHLVEREKK